MHFGKTTLRVATLRVFRTILRVEYLPQSRTSSGIRRLHTVKGEVRLITEAREKNTLAVLRHP